MKMYEYLHLYLGCDTNFGKLIGVHENSCFIQKDNGEIFEKLFSDEQPVRLLLRKISDLNVEESETLNKKGLNIGRPRGYSFSPDAILYLLHLRIDLFNLIGEGMAIEITGNT
ncbi:MAG: hypothetical protein ABI683_02525 [Ginsengibacter sp.]